MQGDVIGKNEGRQILDIWRKRGQIYFSCSSFDPVVEKGSNSHAGQVESRV